MADYDVIVVGAGIEGSATAYWCRKNGLRVLLLEQFPLPHTRGSSHGAGRATRYAYAEPHYARMMEEAFPLWALLEKESKKSLYRRTGMLVLSEPSREIYEQRMNQVKNLGKPVEELSTQEMERRYPAFRASEGAKAFIDVEAGVLRANTALRCFQDIFKKLGGHLHDGEQVVDILPGAMVTVKTQCRDYKARNVVLTPGPWASKLLKPLGLQPPLTTWRINVMYWREKTKNAYHNFPVFVDLGQGRRHIYGLPGYPGMLKINYHSGMTPNVDPDERDKILSEKQRDIKKVSSYVAEHFPELTSTPAIVETCMYTNTPDSDLILDRHPIHPNIIIGCGFSGHGFKLAPVVGRILCDLVMGRTPRHDITPCSLRRFKNSALTPAKL